MPNNSLEVVDKDISISLSPEVFSKLSSWEDWVNYYIQLGEASNSFSWYKADLLFNLFQKYGEGSLDKFAGDVGESKSTVVNYVRTARAFPPEKRIPSLSFSHHFQASFADSYNEKEKDFEGDNRFELIEKAADNQMSTRALQDEVKDSKKDDYKEEKTCIFTGVKSDKVQKYIFYSPEGGRAEKMYLLPESFEKIIKYIYHQ